MNQLFAQKPAAMLPQPVPGQAMVPQYVPHQLTAQDTQAALTFLEANTSHIEATIYARKYASHQYPGLIPIDMSAAPMSKTVTYYSSDRVGKAGWINGNSNDVPTANATMQQYQTPVYTAAIGYTWGWEEVLQAMQLGYPLLAEKGIAARTAYEDMIEDICFNGSTEKNFSGLLNYPGVANTAPLFGTWAGVTVEDQILADINELLTSVGTATNNIIYANTILLPYQEYHRLNNARLGDTQGNLLGYLMRYNTYTAMTGQPLTIQPLRGLDTAGAGGTQRMIAYRRDMEVLKLHLPMPLQFFPLWQSGVMTYETAGVFRCGGLDIRLPNEVRYMDGI